MKQSGFSCNLLALVDFNDSINYVVIIKTSRFSKSLIKIDKNVKTLRKLGPTIDHSDKIIKTLAINIQKYAECFHYLRCVNYYVDEHCANERNNKRTKHYHKICTM